VNSPSDNEGVFGDEAIAAWLVPLLGVVGLCGLIAVGILTMQYVNSKKQPAKDAAENENVEEVKDEVQPSEFNEDAPDGYRVKLEWRNMDDNDDGKESENIVTTSRVAAAFALTSASYDAAEPASPIMVEEPNEEKVAPIDNEDGNVDDSPNDINNISQSSSSIEEADDLIPAFDIAASTLNAALAVDATTSAEKKDSFYADTNFCRKEFKLCSTVVTAVQRIQTFGVYKAERQKICDPQWTNAIEPDVLDAIAKETKVPAMYLDTTDLPDTGESLDVVEVRREFRICVYAAMGANALANLEKRSRIKE